MASLANGRVAVNKKYVFVNYADGNRALRVWRSSTSMTPAALSNVCLKTTNESDASQQWSLEAYGGAYILRSEANTSTALDLYTGSGTSNGQNINAHIYAPSDTSLLTFDEGKYSNTVRIRLAGAYKTGYYLTGNQDNDGTSSGKTVQSDGNVYFYSTLLSDDSQEWIPVDLEEDSSSDESDEIGNQTLCMPVNNMRINVGYKVPIYKTDSQTAGLGEHYGADYIDNRLPGGGVHVQDNIIASGEGYVYRSGLDENAGYFACIVYPNAYVKTSSSGARVLKDITVRYWHMENLNPKFNNVNYTSPVRIHKNDVIGTMGKRGVATGIHLHVECDEDTTPRYTFWSPTHWKNPDILQNGTDSTINPGRVFVKGSNQTVTINRSDITYGWVLSEDYQYIGNYTINENA